MSEQSYEFPGLPLDTIQAGTTVLVSASGRIGSQFARTLLFAGGHEDGIVYVTTNNSSQTLLTDIAIAHPDLDLSRLGIIDATGRGDGDSRGEARVEAVSSTGDLTGISIKNSVLSSTLDKQGVGRVRTCFDSLSMLLLYTNFRTVLRFVHTVAGRISTTDGLGVFVLDPSMHDPQVRYTLRNVCDGEIQVRHEGESPEMQTQGLRGQSSGWQPIEL